MEAWRRHALRYRVAVAYIGITRNLRRRLSNWFGAAGGSHARDPMVVRVIGDP